ncbi:hypothetical protein IDH12_00190 [Pelagibacterales bacterium SAG-MED29]|nr:hypothetical protein [Pelagibacterales bacterium SAG-MED29]
MKKIFVLLLTFSIWSSPLYASKMNDLLKQNFKIVKTEIVKFERAAVKIFTLKKYKTIYICSQEISAYGVHGSECNKP